MTKYTLLDYDGYVCKSLYAAISSGDISEAPRILRELEQSAYDKMFDYFDDRDIEVIKVMSGHSWKKDKYPDYKAKRKKDPRVKEFRNWVLENDKTILKVEPLEADEVLVIMHDCLGNYSCDDCVVFSDDKDLHNVSLLSCKINTDKLIDISYNENKFFCQMLAGDKEDCVTGIPKVGVKTAEKLLQEKGKHDLPTVIQIYKEKGISEEECNKQLNLIDPLKRELVLEEDYMLYDIAGASLLYEPEGVEFMIEDLIKSQIEYIRQEVRKVYAESDK